MSRLEPEKLRVEFRQGVTEKEPIRQRHYTLTHSDITEELFLTIGLQWAYDMINEIRDEVLGEWACQGNMHSYYVYLYIDGEFKPEIAAMRDAIFRRELPLALEAIRYGDQAFFERHKELDAVPIFVFFESSLPKYHKVENWGTFSDYVWK